MDEPRCPRGDMTVINEIKCTPNPMRVRALTDPMRMRLLLCQNKHTQGMKKIDISKTEHLTIIRQLRNSLLLYMLMSSHQEVSVGFLTQA
jgi:hypothetical protein